MSDSGNAASVPSCSGFRSGPERTGSAEQSRVWSLSSSSQRGRLPSLRTRDLTLGGAFRKTKKTWEPNVHAVRKPKDELQTENPVAPKKEKRERDAKRKESRGGRKARPQVIQSHSIFEQCPGVSNYRTGRHGARGLQSSSTSPVCRPVKKEGKNSTEDEDHLLSKLQRDDFIVDPELRNDAHLNPIALPLYQSSSFSRRPRPSAATSGQDDLLVLTAPPCGADGKAALLTDWQKSEQLSLVKMLQELSVSGGEELFLMQFPDCLPGRHSAPKADLHHGGATEKPSKTDTKSAQQESGNMDGSLVLSEFPEGFLGKLQIRKSGKVELKLGDIILDVSEGAAFSFLQQLVSVRLSGGRTGNMTVLGNVHHKLVLSPDFQSLLRQVAAQQP
ncbi:PREDICTED: DNA-directed RNA polymerase III subunit RPC4-like isoform X1 [Poecilia mexicana]|uniref:DNA-directed RNA polymerase III subunit RPC4-like isoform X1 n=1 Tax=Poecilia mexicana TaxID=48701 RepID=UPI00072D9439|nr:PREDICTED: DNA-directed RNA polymerase III subunit RPC4-like isoform X1 [Poecilia mexicana]